MADVNINVRTEFEKSVSDLKVLLEKKEAIEVEIARQRRKVAAWQELCAAEEDVTVDPGLKACSDAFLETILDLGGLTDACRTVLRASRKVWMTATEIQAGLRELGFPMEKYRAPYASITTTVNRMADGENAEVAVNRRNNPGATEYRWVGPKYLPMTDHDWERMITVSPPAPDSLAARYADGRLMEQSLELSKRVQQKLRK